MKKISTGRNVDLSGINIQEILDLMNSDNRVKQFIKCHTFIALYNGNSMQDVCAVFGLTRETVRRWKLSLRQGGINALLQEKKAGKRTKISAEKQKELKRLIKQKPKKYGYDRKNWTGKILKEFMEINWNVKIGIRTAQLWLKYAR